MQIMRLHPTSITIALALTAGGVIASQDLTLPLKGDSVKFGVIGDSGTGGSAQIKVADRLTAARAKFPYDFVLMLGDNLYGSDRPVDYEKKFEKPYKTLLDSGIKFYAALGNHDNPNQRFYKHFNMNGQRFFTFRPPKSSVRFFVLDSNYVDKEQLGWLEKELGASGSDWKICLFHHPLYSSGARHGSDLALREQLEPVFVKHKVDVVFTGHDHFYERTKPQKGITYFVSGGAAKLRGGDIERSPLTERGFDSGYHFMLIEIAGDEMHFQVISEEAKTVDSGVIRRTK